MTTSKRRLSLVKTLCGFTLLLGVSAVGCQVNVGGQTHPSGYYYDDDLQYFAPGQEFPLSNEAAAQAIRRAEMQKAQR